MKAEDIKKVAGIGGGIIGGSWAVLFASKGLQVALYDINDDCIANDKKTIEGRSSRKNFLLYEHGGCGIRCTVHPGIRPRTY